MIKAVFFDIDDTLFYFSKASRCGMDKVEKYMQETLAVSKEEFKQALDFAQEQIANRLGIDSAAFHNRQIRFQNMLEILNLPIYPHANILYDLYWNTVIEMATPEPGLEEVLKSLKQKGIHIGIGSDMTSYIQNKKLEKMNIAKYFDSVVTSEEAGRDKPASALFNLCVQKAKCTPEECLFIGDHVKKDYLGAKSIGMRALCYGKYSKPVGIKAEDVIESYDEQRFLNLIS